MSLMKSTVLLLLPLVAGCIVVHEEPPRRYAAPPPQEPAPVTETVVTQEDEQVHYVVYREYFGASEEEIAYLPHYRRYYGVTDDDLYFIYFTSRLAGIAFDLCFRTYYHDCGRNYDRLVVYYRVPRERYFVAIGVGVSTPPMYARTYGCYRSGNYASVTFTNHEYVSLVHMKVGCEYQGHPPATYFARVQATGSSSRVIVESRDKCGSGGRTATGATVQVTATRAWTLPPQQREQFHQEHQAKAAKTELTFKDVHKEQVTKFERQQPQAKPAPPAAQGGGDKPHVQGQPPAESNRPAAGKPSTTDRVPPQKQPAEAEHAPGKQPPPKQPPPVEKPKGSEKPKSDDKEKDKKDK